MKQRKGTELGAMACTIPYILHFRSNYRIVVSFTLWPIYPSWRAVVDYVNCTAQLYTVTIRKSLSSAEDRVPVDQSSRFSDWAIPGHIFRSGAHNASHCLGLTIRYELNMAVCGSSTYVLRWPYSAITSSIPAWDREEMRFSQRWGCRWLSSG